MFYEMLTGRPPFIKNKDGIADSDFAIQQAHVNRTPINPKKRVPSIPEDLDGIIMAALKKNPDERIPGCGEFLRLLEERGRNLNGGKDGAAPTDRRATILIMGFLLAVALIFFIFLLDR
jgi:serine/threonine-protein kinase